MSVLLARPSGTEHYILLPQLIPVMDALQIWSFQGTVAASNSSYTWAMARTECVMMQISNICIASQMAHADCLHMFVCNCNKFASSFLLNTGDLLAGHWLLIQMHGSYLAHILHQLLAAASCHDGTTMTAGCRTLVWLAPADTMMA